MLNATTFFKLFPTITKVWNDIGMFSQPGGATIVRRAGLCKILGCRINSYIIYMMDDGKHILE